MAAIHTASKMSQRPAAPRGAALDTPLVSLFGEAGAQTFLTSHWPKRFYAPGPGAGLPAILRCPELHSLGALAQKYVGGIAFGRGSVDARTMTADAHPCSLFNLGFTVYLADIAGLLTGGAAWLATLERELGVTRGCSKIGAFASPRGDGLPCHFDADDVISIQLTGSKSFDIAKVDGLEFPVGRQFGPRMLPSDDLYPQVSEGFPDPKGVPFERIRMEPGSVLFIPRGTWHKTHAESDSFSVSIGMRPPSALDSVLYQLRFLLLQDPEWRRPLYGACYPDGRRDTELLRVESLMKTLPAAVAQLTASDLAPLRPGEGGRGRYQHVPMSGMHVVPLSGRLRLTVSAWDHDWIERTTLQTEVPQELGQALDWLAQQRAAFDVTEFRQRFQANSTENLDQLLDLLCKSNYLRRLWFPLLSVQPRTGL